MTHSQQSLFKPAQAEKLISQYVQGSRIMGMADGGVRAAPLWAGAICGHCHLTKVKVTCPHLWHFPH